eukprot:4549050-Amphidinium_carterae.1
MFHPLPSAKVPAICWGQHTNAGHASAKEPEKLSASPAWAHPLDWPSLWPPFPRQLLLAPLGRARTKHRVVVSVFSDYSSHFKYRILSMLECLAFSRRPNLCTCPHLFLVLLILSLHAIKPFVNSFPKELFKHQGLKHAGISLKTFGPDDSCEDVIVLWVFINLRMLLGIEFGCR